MNDLQRTLLLFCTILMVTSITIVNADNVTDLRVLVVSASTYAEKTGCHNTSILADNFRGLRDRVEYRELESKLVDSWRTALDSFSLIAKSDMEKAVLLFSCGSLDKKNYIELLKNLTQLTENGELNSEIYYSVQNPYNEQSDAWSVLTKEYQNPDVIDIIERSIVIFKDRPERLEFYNNILSGDNSRQIHEFEMSMYGKTNPFNKTELGRVDEGVPDNQKTVMWFFCTGVLGVIVACIALIVFRLK